MTPYPTELRRRVVAAVEDQGVSCPEVARIFQVGLTFVKKMLRVHRAGESLEPRHGGGPVPLLQEKERRVLREELKVCPDATLEELPQVLRAQCLTPASVSTISRCLQELHLPRKKSLSASERDEKARKKFRTFTNSVESDRFGFLDEMGSHLGLTRLYGRATPGQRVHDKVPGDRGGNVSTIGALGLDGMRTGLSVPGPIDGETMLCFVEELLVPTLKRGEIVVMDNCPSHKLDDIEDAIVAAGAWVVFLPPYSPDLNPIENCWSKVKARLRALKPRTLEALLEAWADAFALLTPHDIRAWFRHCGYQVAFT